MFRNIFILVLFFSQLGAYASPLGLRLPAAIYPHLTAESFSRSIPGDPAVLAPLIKAVESSGKRTRPILCYLAGGLVGRSPEQMSDMACIVEWTHTASLLHDDVIDNSVDRRGLPTAWTEIGVPRSVLAGDHLFTAAVARAYDVGSHKAGREILRVIQSMTEGEFFQAGLIERGYYTKHELERVYFLKTGVLFQWTMHSPFYLAGVEPPPPQVEDLLRQFGQTLSYAFQRRDDLIDSKTPQIEVNAVFLRAAELAECSPFATSFPDLCFQQATREVADEVRAEFNALRSILAQIWFEVSSASPGPSDFAQQCHQALLSVIDYLDS